MVFSNWKRLSFKNKIMIPMFVVAIIPILFLGTTNLNAISDAEILAVNNVNEEAQNKLTVLAVNQASKINQFFNERYSEIIEMSTRNSLVSKVSVLLDNQNTNYNTTFTEINAYLSNIMSLDNNYMRIMIIAKNGSVLVSALSEEAIKYMEAWGENTGLPNSSYANKEYVQNTLANKDKIDFYDFKSSTYGYKTIDLAFPILSYTITLNSSIIATFHFSVNLEKIYEKIYYETVNGEVDDDYYNEIGLGISGEVYLVTKGGYIISPSRFYDKIIWLQKIENEGVSGAINNGITTSVYDDYRSVKVIGVGILLNTDTLLADNRSVGLIDHTANAEIPWILLSEIDYSETTAIIQEIQELNLRSINVMRIIVIVSIISILFISNWLSSNLTQGLNILKSSMEKGSSGDLRMNMEETISMEKISQYEDEVGKLSLSYNFLINSIKDVIRETQISVGILTNTSEDLLTGTEEINASAEEVASTSQAMSDGATTQTELISEVNDNLINMQHIVDDIVKKIQLNTQEVSQIALQTNILALNAGIEASRAGDYGRGFAVVAENVRKLSDQSKLASERIETVADEIRETLQVAFNSISNTMVNVVSVSEETAASAEEVAAAAEEMTATIEELSTAAEKLSIQANRSEEAINLFTIDENSEIKE